MAAGVVRGDDYNAGCVGCENPAGGGGGLVYVGTGCGEYQAQSTYRYVGYGGDFTSVRRRRDFTCLITTVLLAMLMLLLFWISWPCEGPWMLFPRPDYCFPTPPGPWPTPTPPPVTPKFAGAVDPYNCASDFAAWHSSWSHEKKMWCCDVHGKGCGANPNEHPNQGNNWFFVAAFSYDCGVGFANYMKGWSQEKASWCCAKQNKGCGWTQEAHDHAGQGFGAQAQQIGISNAAAGGGAPVAVVRSHFNPNYAPPR